MVNRVIQNIREALLSMFLSKRAKKFIKWLGKLADFLGVVRTIDEIIVYFKERFYGKEKDESEPTEEADCPYCGRYGGDDN